MSNGGNATEDIANMPPGQQPSSQQPPSVANGGNNNTTNGGCNPTNTMSMFPQIKVRTLGYVENGRLLKQEPLDDDDYDAAGGGHSSSGNAEYQDQGDQVPNPGQEDTTLSTTASTVPQSLVGGLQEDERDDLVEFMINQSTRGQQQQQPMRQQHTVQPTVQQHQQPHPPSSPISSSQVKLEPLSPESSGIKTEILDFDSTLPYDGELLPVKKEEFGFSATNDYMDAQCRPKRYQYFSGESDESDDDQDQECDCPDCLIEEVQIVDQNEPSQPPPTPQSSANADNLEIPAEWYAAERLLRPRTARQQQQGIRTTRRQVKRCTWEGCEYTNENTQTMYVHIRTRHFGVPATKALQKAANNVEERPPSDFMRNELIEVPVAPLTDFEADQLEAVFRQTRDMTLQEYNSAMENLAYHLKIHERRITDWFKHRRQIQKQMEENGGAIVENVNRCKRGRPPTKKLQQQQIRQQLIQQQQQAQEQQQQSGQDETQEGQAGCSFWNGQQTAASSNTSENADQPATSSSPPSSSNSPRPTPPPTPIVNGNSSTRNANSQQPQQNNTRNLPLPNPSIMTLSQHKQQLQQQQSVPLAPVSIANMSLQNGQSNVGDGSTVSAANQATAVPSVLNLSTRAPPAFVVVIGGQERPFYSVPPGVTIRTAPPPQVSNPQQQQQPAKSPVSNSTAACTTNSGSSHPANNNGNSSRNDNSTNPSSVSLPRNTTNSLSLSGTNSGVNSTDTPPPPRSRIPCKHVLEAAAAFRTAKLPPPVVIKSEDSDSDDDIQILPTPSTSFPSISTPQRGTGATNTTTPYHKIPCRRASAQLNRCNTASSASMTPRASTFAQSNNDSTTFTNTATQLGIRRIVSDTVVEPKTRPAMCQARLAQLMADIKQETAKQLQSSVPEKVACLIRKEPPPPNSCILLHTSRFTAFSRRGQPPPPPITKEKQQDYSSKVMIALQNSGCLAPPAASSPAPESSPSTEAASTSPTESNSGALNLPASVSATVASSSASTTASSTPTVSEQKRRQLKKPTANQNRSNERLNESSSNEATAASTPAESNSVDLNLPASASTIASSAFTSSASTTAASTLPTVNKPKKQQQQHKQPSKKPTANQNRSNERLNETSTESTVAAVSPTPPPPRVARVHPLPPPSRSSSSSTASATTVRTTNQPRSPRRRGCGTLFRIVNFIRQSTARSRTGSSSVNNNNRIGPNVVRPTVVANGVSVPLENVLLDLGVSLADAIAVSSLRASNPFWETSSGTVSAVTTSTTVTTTSSSRPEPRVRTTLGTLKPPGTSPTTSRTLATTTSTISSSSRPSEHRPHHPKVARTSSGTSLKTPGSPRTSAASTFSSSSPTEQPKVPVSGTPKNPLLSRSSSLGSSSLSSSVKASLTPSSSTSTRTEISQQPKPQQNKQPQRPSSFSNVQRQTSRNSLDDSSMSSVRGRDVPSICSPPPSSAFTNTTKSGSKRYRQLSGSEDSSATPPVKRQTSRPELENSSSSRYTFNKNEQPRSVSSSSSRNLKVQQKYPQNREPQQQPHYPQAPKTPRRELTSPTRSFTSGVVPIVVPSAPTTVTTATTPTTPTESVRARLSSFLDPRSQAMPLSSAGVVPVANRVPSRPLPRQTSLTEVGSTLSRLAASSTASSAGTLSRQNSLGNEAAAAGSKTPRRISNDGVDDHDHLSPPRNRDASSSGGGVRSSSSGDRNSSKSPQNIQKVNSFQKQRSIYASIFESEEQNNPPSSSSSSRPPPSDSRDSRKESTSNDSRISNSNPPGSSSSSNLNSSPRDSSSSSSSNSNSNQNRDSSASSSTYSSKYSTYSNSASTSSSNQQVTESAASTTAAASTSSPTKITLNEYSRKYQIYRKNNTTRILIPQRPQDDRNRTRSPPPPPPPLPATSSRPPPPTSPIINREPEPRLLDSTVPRIPITRVSSLDGPSAGPATPPVDPRLVRTSIVSTGLVSETLDSVYPKTAVSSAPVARSTLFNSTVRSPPPPPGVSIPVRTDPRMSNYSFPSAAAAPSVSTTSQRSLISVRTDARLFNNYSFAGEAASPSSSTLSGSAIPVLTDARMSNYSFPVSSAAPSAPKAPLLPTPSVTRSTSFNSTVGSPAPESTTLVPIEPRMSNYSIVPGSAVPSPGPTAPPVSTDNPAQLFPNDVDYRLLPNPPTENSRTDARSSTSNFSYPQSRNANGNRSGNIILGHVTVQMDAKSSQIVEDRTTQLPLEVVPTAEEMLKELQSLPLVDDDDEEDEEELLSLPEILDDHLIRMKSGGSNGSFLDITATTGKSVDDLFGMVMKSANDKEDLSKNGDDQPKNVEDQFGIVLRSADDDAGQKNAEELMMLQDGDHTDAKELNDQEEEELLKDDAEKELNDEEEEELLKGDEEDEEELEKEEEASDSEEEEEDSDSDYEVVDSYIVPPVLTLQPAVKTEELEVELDNSGQSPVGDYDDDDQQQNTVNNVNIHVEENIPTIRDEPVQQQEQQESENLKNSVVADDGLDEEAVVVVEDSVVIKEEDDDIEEEEMDDAEEDEEDDEDDDCFEVVDSCVIPANVLVVEKDSVEILKSEPETQKASTIDQVELALSEPMDLDLMEQPEEQQEEGSQNPDCSSNVVPAIEKVPEATLAYVSSIEYALAVSDSVGTETLEESSNGHVVPTEAVEMFQSTPVVTIEENIEDCQKLEEEVHDQEADELNLEVVEENSEKVESILEVSTNLTKVEPPPKSSVPTESSPNPPAANTIEPRADENPESEPPSTTTTTTIDSTELSTSLILTEELVAELPITIDDSNSLVLVDGSDLGGSAKLSSPSLSQRLVQQDSTEFEPNMAILEPELTEISEPVALNPPESVVIPKSEPSTSSDTTSTVSSNVSELGSPLSQAKSTEPPSESPTTLNHPESSEAVDSCPMESQLCEVPPLAAVEFKFPPLSSSGDSGEPVELPSSSSVNSVLEKVAATESPTKPTTRSQASQAVAETSGSKNPIATPTKRNAILKRMDSSSSLLSKSQDEDADDEDDEEEGDSNGPHTPSKRPKRSKAQLCIERNQSLLKSAKSCKATISEASSSTSTPSSSKAKKCLVKSISSDNFYSTRRSLAANTNAESEDGGGGGGALTRKRSLRERSVQKVDSPVKKAKTLPTPPSGSGKSQSDSGSSKAPYSSTPSRPALRSSTVSSSTSVVEAASSSSSSPAQPTRQSLRISSSRAQAEEEAAIAAAPPGARDRREYFRDYMRKYRDTKNTTDNANQTANKNPVPSSSSSATKRKGSK